MSEVFILYLPDPAQQNRVSVLFAFLPRGQRLYIVVNGPSTNRKLIGQELTDVEEIRKA